MNPPNFLCSKCRSWLSKNEKELPARCENSYKWGVQHYRKNDLNDALTGIGSAYEMAEIMLRSSHFCSSYSSRCLLATSEVLVRILDEMDRHKDSFAIQIKTSTLLEHYAANIDIAELMPEMTKITQSAQSKRSHLRVVH